ncbi:unnamed protein product [Malus baccata var. baccata]
MNNSTCHILLVCLILVFLPLSHCSRAAKILQMEVDLIDQTCKVTPNYDLCVSSLESDPRRAYADVAGLGLIIVNVATVKATDVVNKIEELLKQNPDEKPLKYCTRYYRKVLEADIPEASQGFRSGNPKFAEEGMIGATGEAESCESSFSGKSPLTDMNKVFIPLSHCSRDVIFPMDANIIDQTCKKTPDYNLCVSSLNSDPRSATADVAVLGLSPSDPLNSCTHFYKTILEADIPKAAKAFIGNPKFAEQGMNDGFSGKSPLINENKVVHDFLNIINKLLKTFFVLRKMRYSACLIQLLCLVLVFLPLSHCRRAVIFPMDANLIDQTCKKTPNYNLCVSSLKSDPRSVKADVAGLGFITVDIAKDKATDTANRINELLKQSPSDQRLKTCATFYHTILVADVPEASQGFKLGNPKFAEQGMNDAADAAEACEKEFSSKSPLTDKTKVVHDLSRIIVKVVRDNFKRKPVIIFVVDMARSGKTTFMQQLVSHTYESHIRGYVMNLDSAVMTLPFDANIDIRDTVRYKEVMKQINLGPNEGTLACESNKPIMIISNFRLSQSLGSGRINLIMFSYTWILPVRLRYSLDPSLELSSQKHLHPHFLLLTLLNISLFGAQSLSLVLDEFYKNLRSVGVSAVSGAGMKDFFKAVEASAEEYMESYKKENMEKLRKDMEKSGGETVVVSTGLKDKIIGAKP